MTTYNYKGYEITAEQDAIVFFRLAELKDGEFSYNKDNTELLDGITYVARQDDSETLTANSIDELKNLIDDLTDTQSFIDSHIIIGGIA